MRTGTRPARDPPADNSGIAARNILLEHFPRDVRKRIQKELSLVLLKRGQIIHRSGDKIRYLYFPLNCLISVTVTMSDGRTVDAGAIGNREVVGINAIMGAREVAETEYVVQLAGSAFLFAGSSLKAEFDRSPEMRDVMLRYAQAFIAQITQNVACNRHHAIDKRFARCLLEVQDRVGTIEFPLTHESLAHMLGVRRAGVTEAASKLTHMGIIEHGRGHFKINNLQALRKESCECYTSIKAQYDRLLS